MAEGSDSDEGRDKNTELFDAIRKGKLDEVKLLLENGVSTNIIDRNNKDNSPLHYAVERGKIEIVVELLSSRWKTNINLQNKQGNTPLHIATLRCNTELVQLLLNNQAEISVRNKEDEIPLDIAKKHGTLNGQEIVDILEKSLSKPSNQVETLSKQSKDVNEKLTEFKETFNKVVRHPQEASQQRQEIANCDEEGRTENREGFKKVIHKFNELTRQESKQVRRPIWFDVRESVQSFTGREEELDQIATVIKQGIVVISGLGGVGKSELAIKYARSHYSTEDSVIWINGETQENAKESFRRLLKELGIKTKDQDGDEKSVGLMAKEAYDFVAGKTRLIVFDNAEKHSVIKEFLPSSTSGYQVLITSQNRELLNEQEQGKVARLSLDTLSEDKAIEFVKEALNISNELQDEEIKELVKTLGYLPLALQHAVSYIKESGYVETIGKYTEVYRRSEQEIQSFLNRECSSCYKTILLTFKTTIDKVKQLENGKLAEEILNTIAYFASDHIPKEIIFKLAQDRVEENDVSIKNDGANGMLTRAINLLGQYSIISLKEEQVSIHKLVQEVIRSELKKQSEEGRVLEVLEKALGLVREYTKAAPRNAANCIPHIISIWDYASKYDELIGSFIVDSNNNKATTATKYFDLIIEGSNYEVIDAIIKRINFDNLKEVINGKSKDDVTPLHKAVLRNDEKIVKLVIDGGADVNAKKSNGWTSLLLAAKIGNLKVVKALLEKGANVDDKTSSKYQFTPLHLAARNGHKEVIEALLDKNANVNDRTEYEFTPLHLAADNGHLDAVQALLEDNQIIINAETKDKSTPLLLASKSGHLSVVEALLANSADVNAQNKDGFAPLHFAALNGHAEVINKLLENHRIDIDARTTQGNTALHLAAEKGHLQIAKALIARNADIDIKNGGGNTASDVAQSAVEDYLSSIYKRTKGAAGIEGQLCEINLSLFCY
jgi:ankyrin repeat protein